MEKTVVDLFAGVGGFRIGLESNGNDFKTVWGNQWEPNKKVQYAFDCYKNHFQEDGGVNQFTNQDISKVDTKDIPSHTLLVGGFPCQDYSVARTGAKGLQGKKGVLWWEIDRIIQDKKPPFILLENVDRLLKSPTSQRGRDFGVMLKSLDNNNYDVEWRVINAADYGFQQKRRRVFIFASNRKNNYRKQFENDAKEIITKKGFFAPIFPIDENIVLNSINLIDDIVEISDNFHFQFNNSGFMKDGVIYTAKVKPNKLLVSPALTLGDILEKDVPERFFISEDELEHWKYLKGAKEIKRKSKTGHEYYFREGAIPFPDKLDIPARTMLTSERTKNRSSHLIQDPQNGKFRKLTPLECERINGFPDDWTNTGMPESFRYFCMGNALVVDLIKIMGGHLSKIIDNES